MRNASGAAVVTDPDGTTAWERDTTQCGHCSRVIFVKPGTAITVYLIQHRDGRWTEEAGAFCRVCMKPVCLPCHREGGCRPLEAWLESMEIAGRRLVTI